MTKDDLLVFEKQRELWVPSELQTIGCEKPELWVQIQGTVIICSPPSGEERVISKKPLGTSRYRNIYPTNFMGHVPPMHMFEVVYIRTNLSGSTAKIESMGRKLTCISLVKT
jgi:hypothetical protein